MNPDLNSLYSELSVVSLRIESLLLSSWGDIRERNLER